MKKDLSRHKIVLIGGAGFIGTNLAVDLKEKGAEVHVIDSLQVNNLLWHSAQGTKNAGEHKLYLRMINDRLALLREADIMLHPGDARDYHLLNRIIDQIKPDTIIHLAAVSHAGRSNKDPHSTFDHSLRTLENALDCARGAKVKQFIYFSSSMVYGNFRVPSVDEDQPLDPMGIYGALKVAGEKIVIAYNQVFGLTYTIIRPSALYGPRCVSRRVGQIFIESALNGEDLKIDGDGGEKLDFTFIEDLAEGVSLAIGEPKAHNQIFNMTYGASRSIKDLADIVSKRFPEIGVNFVPRDKLMPFRGTLCVDKAKDLLGYAPCNPIDVGIPKYIDWYEEMLGVKAPAKEPA